MIKKMTGKPLLILAFIAGLCYNAWLLGFWLNPTVLRTRLLSSLGALNQPFHEVFILADIISGIATVLVALGLYWQMKARENSESKGLLSLGFYHKLMSVSILIFGILTVLAALFAEECQQGDKGCPELTTNPVAIAHATFSSLALFFIALALLASLLMFRQWLFGGLVALCFSSMLLASIEALFPQTIGPWGQQLNSIFIAIWLFVTTGKMIQER